MPLQINDVAPNFSAETTEGPIRFHEWAGDSWVVAPPASRVRSGPLGG